MFQTKNVAVYPNFDNGSYMGTFTIIDAKDDQYNLRYPSKLTKKDFDALSLIILTVVNSYIKSKNEKGSDKE